MKKKQKKTFIQLQWEKSISQSDQAGSKYEINNNLVLFFNSFVFEQLLNDYGYV
jgi:hypothetical protein